MPFLPQLPPPLAWFNLILVLLAYGFVFWVLLG